MDHHIEIVRDGLGPARAEQVLAFWSTHGLLTGADATARLSDLVVVLLDGDGAVVGTNSVYEAAVPLIGGRRFSIYRRSVVPGAPAEADAAMLSAAYDALDERHDPDAGGPVGLCLLVDDVGVMNRHPEAVWPDSALLYAGYTPEGRQVRIRYFTGARIGPAPPPGDRNFDRVDAPPEVPFDGGYRVVDFGASDAVTADDVLALWARHGAVGAEEARRRVHEVVTVATAPSGELIGVSTAYLARSAQLRLDMWHLRAFIAPEHREHEVTRRLLWRARDVLEQRHASGEDTRGAGQLGEIENEALRRRYPEAVLPTWGSAFIGETRSGAHVRVRYFPGALAAPAPATA